MYNPGQVGNDSFSSTKPVPSYEKTRTHVVSTCVTTTLIYVIFALAVGTNSKLPWFRRHLRSNTNSTNDYRILKGATSISFRALHSRVCPRESSSSSPERDRGHPYSA